MVKLVSFLSLPWDAVISARTPERKSILPLGKYRFEGSEKYARVSPLSVNHQRRYLGFWRPLLNRKPDLIIDFFGEFRFGVLRTKQERLTDS